MQQILFTFLLVLSFGITSIQANSNNLNYSIEVDSTSKLNTIVLRHIGGFCDSPTDDYTCFPYQEIEIEVINKYLKTNQSHITELVIENPSYIIYELDLKVLKNLRVLQIYGNDFDTDALYTLPKQLLKLSSLEKIVFDGVRFPSKELKVIKENYPNLEIEGNISEL